MFATVTDQSFANKNILQGTAIPIAIIKYLEIKSMNKFVKLD